jgi:hypothetical protein
MWPFAKEFSLQIHGRAGMTYREGQKTLKIDSEMLVGKYDYAIYWSEVKAWDPPFDGEALSEMEKARIRTNIEKEVKNLCIDWV